MSDEIKKEETKVHADNNSIAVGAISAGGNIGDININTGYSVEQVSVLITQITATFQPKPFDGRCPYKGLDVFEEEDAELFFGREKLMDDLVSRVKESRTVFVTGPSGSGKSSLVRAGLIHTLKQGAIKNSEHWLYATMKPGRDPIESLANAFSRLKSPELGGYFRQHVDQVKVLHECAESALTDNKNQRLVLFIDQFEEVFTQISKEEDRVALLNILTHAATGENGRVIILFSMRSDFVSNCATYPQLNALLNQQFVQIGAMQPEELVSAIAQPALRVGLRIDPDLIAQIINEMKGEPGALPLMQFALKDLFDSQQEKSGMIALTLNDYLQRGGIHKALERHADESFSKLSKTEQELARSIFSGLIEIGRGTQDTRRTVLFDELVPANAKAADVNVLVQKLADARLITTDEQAGKEIVTISHEKLINAWPWLKRLVNENRDAIALQNEISADAKDWDESLRDASFLYRGARLTNALEKLEAKKLKLSGLAMEFIEAGKKNYTSELEQEKKRANRLEILNRISLARLLTAQAQFESITRNPDHTLSLLLAVQSLKIYPTVEAAKVAQASILARPIVTVNVDYKVNVINFNNTGNYLMAIGYADATSVILVLDATTGKEIARMVHDGKIGSSSFSADSRYIASGSSDRSVRVWESLSGQEIARMTHDGSVLAVAFSPDGKYVVSGSDDKTARVWEAATGKEIARMTHDSYVYSVAFSPDGKYVVSDICVWEAITGKEIARMEHTDNLMEVGAKFATFEGQAVRSVCSFNHKPPTVAIDIPFSLFEPTYHAVLWDLKTGKQIINENLGSNNSCCAYGSNGYIVSPENGTTVISRKVEFDNNGEARINAMAHISHGDGLALIKFSTDGNYVVTVNNRGTTQVWDVRTGKEISQIPQGARVVDISPNRDLVVTGRENVIKIWNIVDHTLDIGHIVLNSLLALSPNGKYVVGCSFDHNIGAYRSRVWETSTCREVFVTTHDKDVKIISFSSDGKYIISVSADLSRLTYSSQKMKDFVFEVWDPEAGQRMTREVLNFETEYFAISPDRDHIAFALYDNTIRVWQVATGKECVRIKHDAAYRDAVFGFCPDGKYVVLRTQQWNPNENKYLAISRSWETSTGQEFFGSVETRADNNPETKYENYEISCDNKAIHVLDSSTGREVFQINIDSPVKFARFTSDGKYLLWMSNYTMTVSLWQLEDIVSSSYARLTRNLTSDEWHQYIGDALPYQAICPDLPLEPEVSTTPTAQP